MAAPHTLKNERQPSPSTRLHTDFECFPVAPKPWSFSTAPVCKQRGSTRAHPLTYERLRAPTPHHSLSLEFISPGYMKPTSFHDRARVYIEQQPASPPTYARVPEKSLPRFYTSSYVSHSKQTYAFMVARMCISSELQARLHPPMHSNMARFDTNTFTSTYTRTRSPAHTALPVLTYR